MKVKKLKDWSNEWGDKRGNCSGLIKGCLQSKSYNTCSHPCIKPIKDDEKGIKKIFIDFDYWKPRITAENIIKREVEKYIQVNINRFLTKISI